MILLTFADFAVPAQQRQSRYLSDIVNNLLIRGATTHQTQVYCTVSNIQRG